MPLFRQRITITLLAFTALLISTNIHADNIDLFILAGQSNAQGWRSNAAQYPVDPQRLDKRIPFYYETVNYGSSQQQWQTLTSQPGHFVKGHFGPEVTLGRALFKAKKRVAIYKYSQGGSNLKTDWKAPGKGGSYDTMVDSVKSAIQTLEDEGNTVTPRAFIWIQGESDADSDELADAYYWNLKKLIHHFRTNVIRDPKLPVILSVDEQHPRVQQRPQVVDAQLQLAMEDPTISFVTMHGLQKADVTHLTARGSINQGKRIFKAYLPLVK